MSKNYVRHLAEYYFTPSFDWTPEEALQLYQTNPRSSAVLLGNCLERMQELSANSFPLIIADPPFGINFSGTERCYNRNRSNVLSNYQEIQENYVEFSKAWISECDRILAPTGSMYIISGYTHLLDILNAIRGTSLQLVNHIIWKYNFSVFTSKKFSSSHFHVLFLVKSKQTYFFNTISHYMEDVWEIKKEFHKNTVKNGTKLPEALVQRMIDFSSQPGDTVFDPFMGNGTTAIVAQKHFRKFFGFEVNPIAWEHIQTQLSSTKLGSEYIPYTDRLPKPEALAKRSPEYQKAYEVYLAQQKLGKNKKI